LKSVKQIDVKRGITVAQLIEEMEASGVLGAGKIGKAARLVADMFKDPDYTVFLTLAGALVPGGLRNIIAELIKKEHVNVVVTTGANMVHDLVEAIGFRHMVGTFKAEDFGRIRVTKLPPCIRQLLAKVQAGENLPHSGRFALTAFLHALGMSPEEILHMFSTSPDFDESKTRYQIEHITGKISGTEYTPPECSTMKSYGICFGEDNLCKKEWMTHPLKYYRIKDRSPKRKGKVEGKEKEDF